MQVDGNGTMLGTLSGAGLRQSDHPVNIEHTCNFRVLNIVVNMVWYIYGVVGFDVQTERQACCSYLFARRAVILADNNISV